MYVCVCIICAYLGIIEEREFEERTKDFLFKTQTGKERIRQIYTRYNKKKRTKESRKERERERETKERKEIKR